MGGQGEELKKGIEPLPQTQFANPISLKRKPLIFQN